MVIQQIFRQYSRAIYAAPNLDAAVDVLSDTAAALGFAGAAAVFWPRPKESNGEWPPPSVRLLGSSLGAGSATWNAGYIDRQMFKSDFVYRACLHTAAPVIWSYDNRPEIIVGQSQPATLREIRGIESMLQLTGLRGGVSVPIRGPGSFFGYVAFSSCDRLEDLRVLHDDCYECLLGIAYRFYDANADKLPVYEGSGRHLTARELECLTLLAIGKTLDETAEILGLSYSTVRFHLQNAESKLGTQNRAHAIAKAAFLGLLGGLD